MLHYKETNAHPHVTILKNREDLNTSYNSFIIVGFCVCVKMSYINNPGYYIPPPPKNILGLRNAETFTKFLRIFYPFPSLNLRMPMFCFLFLKRCVCVRTALMQCADVILPPDTDCHSGVSQPTSLLSTLSGLYNQVSRKCIRLQPDICLFWKVRSLNILVASVGNSITNLQTRK